MTSPPAHVRVPAPPRIPPLPPSEWPAPLRSLLAESRKDGAGRVNLFGTLAHHPALAHAWLSLARVLTHEGTLGDRRRELVVLRTAHRLGGTFVHERHRAPATAAGLTAAEILATAAAPHAHPWAREERALLETCDLLTSHSALPDGLWRQLARFLNAEQLIELLVLVGQTTAMCTTLGVLRTPSDGAAPEAPEESGAAGGGARPVPEAGRKYAGGARAAADPGPSGAPALVDAP
ncbi:carboxymuconolactone decarboxylase family protein [Streptomyces fagopyri]|uniref:carboxymuconolactone decarboxylase family protein n=1 Tax=Streptomyces fagopyri TaxID=2662397 RepID=UPI0037FAEE7B